MRTSLCATGRCHQAMFITLYTDSNIFSLIYAGYLLLFASPHIKYLISPLCAAPNYQVFCRRHAAAAHFFQVEVTQYDVSRPRIYSYHTRPHNSAGTGAYRNTSDITLPRPQNDAFSHQFILPGFFYWTFLDFLML